MSFIVIAAILGLIPAFIAQSKGRSFGLWWLYGSLIFIVALIHSIFISGDIRDIERVKLSQGMVKCPFCAEIIKNEAIKCKHCGSDISENIKLDAPVKEFNISD
uniref:zinc ribbon domain-containing protein n=1 Tax=Yersinia aldovae TaxID=29483 RepID=UPI0011A454A4